MPIDQVAKAFIHSLSDPGLQQALAEVDGSPQELVKKRLGPWMLEGDNMAYLQTLMAEVERLGDELGIFEPDTTDQEEAEDEDEAEVEDERRAEG
jgi:hypothetical protein